MKKNIVIVTTFYPPINHVASNRTYSFAKYLDKEKYNVFVVTLQKEAKILSKEDSSIKVVRVKDKSFIKRASFTRKRPYLWHKIKAMYNTILNCFPWLEYRFWKYNAIIEIERIKELYGLDVLLTCYAPSAPHVIGLHFKQKYPHIVWIADMRDEMIPEPIRCYWENMYLVKLQRNIINNADAITSVSKPLIEGFKRSNPNRSVVYKEIRNGYDFDITHHRKRKSNVFHILYAGTLYGKRSPQNFFKVLDMLLREKRLNIKVEIIGSNNVFSLPKNLAPFVTVSNRIESSKAIEKMKSSDLLLLILPTIKQKGAYTGKIFEYLASMRPIFALVPEDDVAASLIRECNAGYICANENMDKMKKVFLRAYEDWEKEVDYNPNVEIIKKHHRKEQVKRLESLIQDIYQNREYDESEVDR